MSWLAPHSSEPSVTTNTHALLQRSNQNIVQKETQSENALFKIPVIC